MILLHFKLLLVHLTRMPVFLPCCAVLEFGGTCADVCEFGCVQASLVLTVQRFLSLVFSAAVLNSPPAPPNSLWVGSGMVLLGSCIYILAQRGRQGGMCSGNKQDGDVAPPKSPAASRWPPVEQTEPFAPEDVLLAKGGAAYPSGVGREGLRARR